MLSFLNFLQICYNSSLLQLKCYTNNNFLLSQSVWLTYFLLIYFTIQLIFAIIHESYCTISANIYLYLRYFQQKFFQFQQNKWIPNGPSISHFSFFLLPFTFLFSFFLLLIALLLSSLSPKPSLLLIKKSIIYLFIYCLSQFIVLSLLPLSLSSLCVFIWVWLL